MISGDDPRDAVVGSAGAPTRADRPAEPPSSPATMVCPSCAGEYGPEVRFCPRDGAVLRAKARSADLSGLVVGGRYRVHRRLGAGGMGTVYLAEHVRMGRRCALKVLSRALSEDAEAASRFAREAANASRVSHPNVATVYDFGETDDGLIYLAMEYVEGEPLSRLVEREGRLPAERAVGIACQIATGLAAAHRAGVVHRDLKPDNVLVAVGEDGGDLVKVIDFGIAKAAHDAEQDLTRTGFVVGTPRYMSPEQLVGEPADGRSDLYALGCILFEMLTGDAPWGGATPAGVTRRLTEAPPHPRALDPRIPVALDGAIVRLLAREREERYPGAEAAAAALARAVGWPGPATRRDASPVPVAPVGGGGAGRAADRRTPGADAPPAAAAGIAAGSRAGTAPEPLIPLPAPQARARGVRSPLVVAALLALLATGGGLAFIYFGVLTGGGRRAAAGGAAVASAPGAPGTEGGAPPGASPAGATDGDAGAARPTTRPADAGGAPAAPAAPAAGAGGPAGGPAAAVGGPAGGPTLPASATAGGSPAPTSGAAAAAAGSTPAAADAGVASTIDALIGRFVRALETRDLDRIKRIDAEADGTDRWWTFLSGPEVTDLRAEGRILSGPDVEGDEGSAVVEVTFHYRAGGAAATRPWPMRITFGRDADGWRIRTVRTLQ